MEPPSTSDLSPKVNIQKGKPICWAGWERIPLLFLLRVNASPQQEGSRDISLTKMLSKSYSLCVLRSFSAVCPGAKLSHPMFCSLPCAGAELGQRVSPGSLC